MANIGELIEKTEAKIINNPNDVSMSTAIDFAICCDLMSDVLMFLRKSDKSDTFDESGVMITGLATMQAIRTAELLDLEYILFVRGKVPNQSVIDEATENDITLLTTDMLMYKCCGELYELGITGIS